MRWMLFLDDHRDPNDDSWTMAKSVGEAIKLIKEKGYPEFVSIGGDLGEDANSSCEFMQLLINDSFGLEKVEAARIIGLHVHSFDSMQKTNIETLWYRYVEKYKDERSVQFENELMKYDDITSLDKQGAKNLVGEIVESGGGQAINWVRFTYDNELNKEVMQCCPTDGRVISLFLPNLQTISAEAAEMLLTLKNCNLAVGLIELTSGVARVFAAGDFSTIFFEKLTRLDLDAAKELNKFGGILSFDALTELSPAAAKALLQNYQSIVDFPRLNISSVTLAKSIATHCHELFLGGVTELTPSIARELSKHRGYNMNLSGVQFLDQESANQLTKYRGKNCVSYQALTLGIQELDLPTATVLSQFEGTLLLYQLKEITDELAEIFSNAKCHVIGFTPGVSIGQKGLRILSQFKGGLSIRAGDDIYL